MDETVPIIAVDFAEALCIQWERNPGRNPYLLPPRKINGNLPRDFFLEILNECDSAAKSYDLIGNLFSQVNTPHAARGGRYREVEDSGAAQDPDTGISERRAAGKLGIVRHVRVEIQVQSERKVPNVIRNQIGQNRLRAGLRKLKPSGRYAPDHGRTGGFCTIDEMASFCRVCPVLGPEIYRGPLLAAL
jgi:hypothetical protein